MKRSGTTDFTITREDLVNGGDLSYVVTADWSLEVSEYGDGSRDEEFTVEAHLPDGKEFSLSEFEELLLKEELSKRGEI